MAPSRRTSDLKLLAAATTAVVFAGLFVAGAIFYATRNSTSDECRRFSAGDADGIREKVEEGGPYFLTGGGNCAFWVALDGDELVALQARIPERDCSILWEDPKKSFTCAGATVALDEIDRYPTEIGTGELEGALIVVFDESTTTTTAG